MRTETQLIIEAYQIQDACNLSGVVHGFSRAISELREACPNQGTEFYNTHIISQLWADKIRSLAISSDSDLMAAFSTASEVYHQHKECGT